MAICVKVWGFLMSNGKFGLIYGESVSGKWSFIRKPYVKSGEGGRLSIKYPLVEEFILGICGKLHLGGPGRGVKWHESLLGWTGFLCFFDLCFVASPLNPRPGRPLALI